MSEVKVNKISPRTNCGTVTLGDSGDSFVIPAGATITNNGTQTGFGRTGTVDWDTTPKLQHLLQCLETDFLQILHLVHLI